LAATRPANDSPRQVNTGNPAHSASLAVVCALQGNVSINRSAVAKRAKCSASGNGLAKIRRAALTPLASASLRRLLVAVSLCCGSHKTLPGTWLSTLIQTLKTHGVILKTPLKQQNTNPVSG